MKLNRMSTESSKQRKWNMESMVHQTKEMEYRAYATNYRSLNGMTAFVERLFDANAHLFTRNTTSYSIVIYALEIEHACH